MDFCQNLGRRSNRTGGMTLPTRELLSSLSAERKLTFAQQQEQERNQKIVQDIAENITHGHLQKSKTGKIEFWDEGINEKIEFSKDDLIKFFDYDKIKKEIIIRNRRDEMCIRDRVQVLSPQP